MRFFAPDGLPGCQLPFSGHARTSGAQMRRVGCAKPAFTLHDAGESKPTFDLHAASGVPSPPTRCGTGHLVRISLPARVMHSV